MFLRTERSVREFIHFYPIVSTLLIINLVLWVFTDLIPTPLGQFIYNIGVGHNYSVTNEGELWRLITPIFLHANTGHVLFNSFTLVLFGPALERMIGRMPFLFAYMATGIIGNIGTLLVQPHGFIPHLGASGAIYGLFGIYIYMSVKRKDLIDVQDAQIIRTIFIIGIVLTFIQPNVNIPAHIFGFLGGLAVATFILNRARPFTRPIYIRHQRTDDDDIYFDPQRWQKKRRLPPQIQKNLFWIIIGAIVLISILSSIW